MPGRLNLRFLGQCTAGAVALVVFVHILHLVQVSRLLDRLKSQAEQNATEGHLERSALYYSRYISHHPEDLDATADYGLVLYRQATTNAQRWRAYRVLHDVLLRKPQLDRIRMPLAHLAVALGQYSEGAQILEPLRGTIAEQSELEQTLAWCYTGAGQLPRAEMALKRAIEAAPNRPDPYLQLADHYRRNRMEAAANQILQRMIDANPGSARMYQARAEANLKLGRLEAAATDLEEALALAPNDVAVWLQAGEIARRRDRLDECRQLLEKGLKHHAQQPRLVQFLAWIELDNEQAARARKYVVQGLEHHPEDVELLALKAEVAWAQQQPDEAKQALEALRRLHPDNPLTHYLEARSERDHVVACRKLEASVRELATLPPWQARAALALAETYTVCGDELRCAQSYQRALQSDPASRQARLKLAALLTEAGELESARTLLQPIQKSTSPSASAWGLYARVLLGLNERALAAGTMEVQWDQVEQALDKFRAAGTAAGLLLTARMWEVRKDSGRVHDFTQQAIREHPRDEQVWIPRIMSVLDKGDLPEANNLLLEARKQVGDRAGLRLTRARWLTEVARRVNGDRKSASEILARQLVELAQNAEKLPAAEQVKLYEGLSTQLQALGATRELAAAAEIWSQALPVHLGGRIVLFDLALQQRTTALVEQRLQAIRDIEGEDGVRWRSGQALWLIQQAQAGDRSGLVQARKLLQDAAVRQPNWPRLALIQARLADLEAKPGEALRYYQRAFDGGERPAWLTERLVRLLLEAHRLLDADRVLRTFQQEQTPTPTLARLGADLARQRGEWPRARELARLAIEPNNPDYREHLWLAEIQELGGDRAAARVTLDHLLKIAGDVPESWIALIRHQARADQRDQARTTLEQAKTRVPSEQLDWLLAQCYEELGDLLEAEAAYRRALEATPSEAILHERLARLLLFQDEPSRALPSLRWLADVSNQAPRRIVQWARRTLALASVGLLAAEPNLHASSDQKATARRLLELNQKQTVDELADRRTGLFLDLLEPVKRKETLAQLEATQSQAPLTLDEQYRLNLLQSVFGDATRARDGLLSLLAIHERNAQLLAAYTRLMIAQKDRAEARRWLTRLERVEPSSRRVEALKKQLAE